LTAQAKTAWTRQNDVITAPLGRVVARNKYNAICCKERNRSFEESLGRLSLIRCIIGMIMENTDFKPFSRQGIGSGKTKNTLNQVAI